MLNIYVFYIFCSTMLGIMQLTMLAPYNNLATSVAAALVPTLLAPKLMHKKPLQGIDLCVCENRQIYSVE